MSRTIRLSDMEEVILADALHMAMIGNGSSPLHDIRNSLMLRISPSTSLARAEPMAVVHDDAADYASNKFECPNCGRRMRVNEV